MASAYCASELRRQGADGSVLLVGREKDPPYERPPLSKEYLRGEAERADAVVNGADWYEENDIELLCGKSVMSLDAGERVAKIQGGEEVRFEKALLGTGAMVNILRVDGAELEGIHYLRAFGNSDAIREEARAGEAGGADRRQLHRLRGGGVARGDGGGVHDRDAGGGGAFDRLRRGGGAVLPGRARVEGRRVRGRRVPWARSAATGGSDGRDRGRARARVRLLRGGRRGAAGRDACAAGGLEVEDGIVCDSRLQTSVEGIFAAGDCCSYDSVVHGRRLRVEHWDVALQQGRHVGKAMLGTDEPYTAIPYFFSDLSDWTGLEYVGPAKDWDEVVFRGIDGRRRVLGVVPEGRKGRRSARCGRSEDLVHARTLIETGADVRRRRPSSRTWIQSSRASASSTLSSLSLRVARWGLV